MTSWRRLEAQRLSPRVRCSRRRAGSPLATCFGRQMRLGRTAVLPRHHHQGVQAGIAAECRTLGGLGCWVTLPVYGGVHRDREAGAPVPVDKAEGDEADGGDGLAVRTTLGQQAAQAGAVATAQRDAAEAGHLDGILVNDKTRMILVIAQPKGGLVAHAAGKPRVAHLANWAFLLSCPFWLASAFGPCPLCFAFLALSILRLSHYRLTPAAKSLQASSKDLLHDLMPPREPRPPGLVHASGGTALETVEAVDEIKPRPRQFYRPVLLADIECLLSASAGCN